MISIRKACFSDAVIIRDMAFSSYVHHFAHLWHDKKEMVDFLLQEYSLSTLQQSLLSSAGCWFIVLKSSTPIGFTKVSWNSSVDEEGPTGTRLDKIYLLPGETGKGYGDVVFTEMINLAKKRNDSFIWLEVLDANPRAHHFYTQQGLVHLKDTIFSSPSQQSILHVLGKFI